jgi:environmental stress-induced protein Ves
MPAPPRVVALADVPWRAWRNGRGRTRELLAWPDGAAWRVRVSVAEIDAAAPFSSFEGVERWFAVVEGGGVQLRIDGVEHRLLPGSAPVRFDGTAAVDAEPLSAATRDLNLMVRDGAGAMAAATADGWWEPHAAATARGLQAGFYAARPTRWLAQLDARRTVVRVEGELAAASLLWFERAPRRLRASPLGSAPAGAGAPGWWLAAAPHRRSTGHDRA